MESLFAERTKHTFAWGALHTNPLMGAAEKQNDAEKNLNKNVTARLRANNIPATIAKPATECLIGARFDKQFVQIAFNMMFVLWECNQYAF